MNLKVLCIIVLCGCLCGGGQSQDVNDDLSDFDFSNEDLNSTEEPQQIDDNLEEDFDNDVEYSDKNERPAANLGQQLSQKEILLRQIMFNSMKSKEMKDNMAKVLPILRVMTPDQKLALATLVTTQVLAPPSSKGLSLDDVSSLFGNNPNTTAELMLPISLDVANLFRRAGRNEKGPTAEELRAPPFKRPGSVGGPGLYRRNIIERPINNNKLLRPKKPSKDTTKEPTNCVLFSENICLKSHDYPIDAIMSSIRRNKHAMNSLLTDIRVMSKPPTDSSKDGTPPEPEPNPSPMEELQDFNEVRRTGGESGFMCPSIVRYARPQKARATSGQWKYIVNTQDHTQTLRLERCLNAGDTCIYLTDNFKSRCVQVYNYHRLLTWDQTSGLHMDIFKVPTCCSCHIDSYKVPFPPNYTNHATTSEAFPGEDLDNESSDMSLESQNQFSNSLSSNNFRKDLPHTTFETYQPEATKVRPPTVERPSLPKYLEAPKPQQTKNYNQSYKRSNTPKPFPSSKRPRPMRRRQPTKPVRDLAGSESNFGAITTEPTTTTTTTTTVKEVTKKINYNYHPIIDFFKPDNLESRMDVNLGDTDWKPVTSMFLATERSQFKKR